MVWEYMTVKLSTDKSFITGRSANAEKINEELNVLGKEGWELVSAFDIIDPVSREIVMIFKRPGS